MTFEGNAYFVLYAAQREQDVRVALTLEGTRYGRLLLIFVNPWGDEFKVFKANAEASLKPGYTIEETVVQANTPEQVLAALEREGVLPQGELSAAVEGTPFFDQVIEQLHSDTLWAD